MTAAEGPRAWVGHHRGPLVTALCAVIGVFCALIGFALPWDLEAVRPGVGVTLAFLAGALIIHLFRQRRPLTMFALGVLLALTEALVTGFGGVGVLIVVSDLAYAAALYSGSRIVDAIAVACTALAVGAAGFLAVVWATGGIVEVAGFGGGFMFGWLITVPVLFASSIWFGRLVRNPRLAAQRERDRADAVERAAAALRQDAVTRERLELSRELHDVIAGHLSAIAMQSTAALERRDTDDAAPLRRTLELVRGSSLDALADMRTMIDVLRGDPILAGVAEAPSRLTADEIGRAVEVAEANGLRVVLRAPSGDALADVPAQVSVVALRTLVEGLTNAAKHAPAASVEVDISVSGGHLAVTVVNPVPESPVGPAVSGSGGVGLVGLAERARLVGGRLASGSDGVVWRTSLLVPSEPPRTTVAIARVGSS